MEAEDINAISVAIVPIYDTLENLIAKNEVYLRGQHVWVEDELGRVGHKIGKWDWKNQAKENAPRFVDLPWQQNPTEAGDARLSMFAVRSSSTHEPKYEEVGANVVVTDTRLKGKTDYFVGTAQNGKVEFWDDELIYDAVAGTVTIKDFVLNEGEKIRIIIPHGISADPDYVALADRVATLEKNTTWLLAPLMAKGAYLIWDKPANQIPEGWEEVPQDQNFEGRSLKIRKPSAAKYDTVGKIGGSEELKLTIANIPQMDTANGDYKFLLKKDSYGTIIVTDTSSNEPNLYSAGEVKKTGTPDADLMGIDMDDPYRIVSLIRPKIDYTP